MTLIDLTQFNIKRPEKINYYFPLVEPAQLINHVKSKNLRNFLKKAEEILAKNNITWEYIYLTEEKFIKWLSYYERKMQEHSHEIKAKQGWYNAQIDKGVKLKGLFFYQNQKMVGSGIVGLHDDAIHLAYKASDHIKLSSLSNSNLGYIIEFWGLKLPLENGAYTKLISMSRNAFGFYNTLGYLEYKFIFGFTPKLNKNVKLLDDVPVNEKGFVLFYGIQNGKFILFALIPESQKYKTLFNKTPFINSGVPYQEIYY